MTVGGGGGWRGVGGREDRGENNIFCRSGISRRNIQIRRPFARGSSRHFNSEQSTAEGLVDAFLSLSNVSTEKFSLGNFYPRSRSSISQFEIMLNTLLPRIANGGEQANNETASRAILQCLRSSAKKDVPQCFFRLCQASLN